MTAGVSEQITISASQDMRQQYLEAITGILEYNKQQYSTLLETKFEQGGWV